jgi:hypothetical protein
MLLCVMGSWGVKKIKSKKLEKKNHENISHHSIVRREREREGDFEKIENTELL